MLGGGHVGRRPWQALVWGRAGEFAKHAAGWQREGAGRSAYALGFVRFESAELAGGLTPEWPLAAAGRKSGIRADLVVRCRQAERIESLSGCAGSSALSQANARPKRRPARRIGRFFRASAAASP
jgi:hypothetical protein